ncbi:MAG: adenosylcobinamide-phosphate synthase CbiB, partial [Burkholderiaceae bacterium]|nr:adenosylcobinamide-phosphate synthase CbiB [Burkholderiaceae bacterium]
MSAHAAAIAATAVVGAALLDRAFGEPPSRLHPVVWFGRLAQPLGQWALAGASARDQVARGAAAWTLLVLPCAAGAFLLEHALQALPPPAQAAVLALLLKPMFAWRMLADEVEATETALAQSLAAGRAQVARLCSRDVSTLDESGVRETALESLAENFNDSLVAPLFWFAVAGLAGAAAYRAANTLDALWGYRGRWEWAGKTAARADDLLSWLPARLSALLLAAPRHWPRLRREAARTPSPNGGWPMAALALTLAVRLRKPGVYALNEQACAPTAADTARALRHTRRAALAMFVLAAA